MPVDDDMNFVFFGLGDVDRTSGVGGVLSVVRAMGTSIIFCHSLSTSCQSWVVVRSSEAMSSRAAGD